MRILVLCPMASEALYFKRALKSLNSTTHEYKVQTAGVGKANSASATALNLFNPLDKKGFDLIAVVGYAAASSFYNQGDLIMPCQAIYHDTSCPPGIVEDLERVYQLQGVDDCTILTGDSFVDKSLAKQLIAKYNDKVLFDMESASVSQIAFETGIPVIVMKFVSDVPDTDSDNQQTFEEFVNTHTDFLPFISYLESL